MLRNTGNSERKQRGQFDVCFIQQLITEPITDSLDPDTTFTLLFQKFVCKLNSQFIMNITMFWHLASNLLFIVSTTYECLFHNKKSFS